MDIGHISHFLSWKLVSHDEWVPFPITSVATNTIIVYAIVGTWKEAFQVSTLMQRGIMYNYEVGNICIAWASWINGSLRSCLYHSSGQVGSTESWYCIEQWMMMNTNDFRNLMCLSHSTNKTNIIYMMITINIFYINNRKCLKDRTSIRTSHSHVNTTI